MSTTSLPSIHEMFPDHLLSSDLRRSRPNQNESPYRARTLLSSDGPQLSNRPYPYDTDGGKDSKPDFEVDECPVGKSTASIDGALLVNNMDALGRKHVCPTCFKRFNRPSSLRIHLNTHTGATPFRCPWPKCGREFNVNSNMRRHYRNHLGASRGQPHLASIHGTTDLRPLAPAPMHSNFAYAEGPHPGMTSHRPSPYAREMIPDSDYQSQRKYAPMPSPPSSHSSLSDEGYGDMDEMQARPFSSQFHIRRSVQGNIEMGRGGSRDGQYAGGRSHRSMSPSSSSSSSSSLSLSQGSSTASRTPSPAEFYSSQPKYNPSKPYSASLDARVRTTLRPAFV